MPKITIDELSTEELEMIESALQGELLLQHAKTGSWVKEWRALLRKFEDAVEIARRDDADSIHDGAMELKEEE